MNSEEPDAEVYDELSGFEIAVVGMACRFPGAPNVDAFWSNLREGVESIRRFSAEEITALGGDSSLFDLPGFVPAHGALDDYDLFDASLFGYTPSEAAVIDPQHRLFLELAWNSLESAGYAPGCSDLSVGVFAGTSTNSYLENNVRSNAHVIASMSEFQLNVLNQGDFLSTRASYKLGLTGPSFTILSACSTSLVATHVACQQLIAGACDIALAGGVSITLPQHWGYQYQEGMIFSPDGHCRTFDEQANGTLKGDGGGIVVLKRLADAIEDGDTIHAVILGSAVNNDAAVKVGYTAPGLDGQVDVIRAAHMMADVDPASISYVECHGTATPMGDPIEVAALTQAFGHDPQRPQYCGLGSVKSNIGHLDAGAGVAGLMKTILSLKNKVLPPSLNYSKPNPSIKFEKTPFYVNDKRRDWPRESAPRRAGVSSFGIGGTNAHIVLQEAAAQPLSDRVREQELIVLSARTETALANACTNLASALRAQPGLNLADVAYTLQVGRKHFDQSFALVGSDVEAVAAALDKRGSAQARVSVGKAVHRSVVFMFSGQGSQYVNMLRGLYDSEVYFKEIVDQCCTKLIPNLGIDLRDVLYPDGDMAAETAAKRLTQTQYTQPALFVIEYALSRLWMRWGIQPVAMIGHSIGEYVAACLAGVMSLDDALNLIAVRGRLMGNLPSGKMLAVPLAASELKPLLDDAISLAIVNGPGMSVLSGPEPAVAAVKQNLADKGVEATLLHTSHAFHSSMMEPILEEFTKIASTITLKPPVIPYVSNVSGTWISDEQATDPAYYADHLRQAVQFSKGLEQLFKQPDWILLEVGPGKTLTSLAKSHPGKSQEQILVGSSRHPSQQSADDVFILDALGKLWSAGINPDWVALHQPSKRYKVVLPSYCFDRQRYWIEPGSTAMPDAQFFGKNSDSEKWLYAPSWQRTPIPAMQPISGNRWLLFVDNSGLGLNMAKALRAQNADVKCVSMGSAYVRNSSADLSLNPNQPADYLQLAADLADRNWEPQHVIHMWLADREVAEANTQLPNSILQRGYFSLRYLSEALAGFCEPANKIVLTVVTTGVQDVTGDEPLCPDKATVLGPCRVIPTEYPFILTQNIDLSDAIDINLAEATQFLEGILAEASVNTPAHPVVAYRGSYRWVQEVSPISLPAERDSNTRFRERGTYLITGGMAGIGRELAGHLARSQQANLVLVGRTVIPDRAQWDGYLKTASPDDAAAERIRWIIEIEQECGIQVYAAGADVADHNQMAQIISDARKQIGAIHGVIHAAGIPGGGILANQSVEAVEAVLSAKIAGTKVLHTLLKDAGLDFMVIFSSLITFAPKPGRSEYLAANAFVDAYAHQQARDDGFPVIAINWDTWVDTGMAVATHGAGTTLEASDGICSAEGIEVLRRILANNVEQVLVSVCEFHFNQPGHSLEELAAESRNEASASIAAYPRPELSTPYQEASNDAERLLAGIWQAILGIGQIGVHDNFFELGGDSVINIQITAMANEAGLALTPKQVFEFQTIAELAAVAGTEEVVEAEQGLVTGAAPLMPIQQWFLAQNWGNPHHFNLAMLLQAQQVIDSEILQLAMQKLLEHHDALRMRFERNDEQWSQRIIDPDNSFLVHNIDLGKLDEDDKNEKIKQTAHALQSSLDICNGPLLQVACFNMGGSEASRLLLVIHHLVVDVISWRILLEDIQSIYRSLEAGIEPSLPTKTVSIKHWAEEMSAYASTPEAADELDHWRQMTGSSIPQLPVDVAVGANSIESALTISRQLRVDETHVLITELPRIFNANINDVLLLALAQAICKWAGTASLFVNMEGHGREAILQGVDPSRTVGWFTSLYPVLLDLPEQKSVAGQLEFIGQQLREIPNNGMGFGVLRYMSNNSAIRDVLEKVPLPHISFLYMGQIGQASSQNQLLSALPGDVGAAHDPAGERAHLLEINSVVQQGQFQISWTFSSNRHQADAVERLADSFINELRLIVDAGVESKEGRSATANAMDGVSESDLAEILRQHK